MESLDISRAFEFFTLAGHRFMPPNDLRKLEVFIEKVRNQLGKAHIQFAVRETYRANMPYAVAFSARHFVHRIELHDSAIRALVERDDFFALVREIRQGFLALDGLLQRARAEEMKIQNQRTGEDRRCGWDRRARPGEPPPAERRGGGDRRSGSERRRA